MPAALETAVVQLIGENGGDHDAGVTIPSPELR
jgi:hypothetical protein